MMQPPEKLVQELTEKIGRRMKKDFPLREAPADTKYIVRETLILVYEKLGGKVGSNS